MKNYSIPRSQRNILTFMYLILVIIPPIFFYRGIYRAFDIAKSAIFIWLFTIIGTTIGTFVILYPGEVKKLKNPITYSILAFDVALILSTIFSLNPSVSFWGVYERQLGLIIFLPLTWTAFLTMFVVYSRSSLQFLYDILIYFGTFNGIYGIIQMLGFDIFWGSGAFGHRAFGFQGNPDFFGPMLILTSFLTLARSYSFFTTHDKKKATTYFIMFTLQVIAIIGSMTRGSWVGFFGGIIVWAILTFIVITPQNRISFIKILAIALIITIILFIALEIIGGDKFAITNRLKTIFVWKSSSGRPIPRLILWRDTLHLIADNMKDGRYTGIGIEVFRRNFMPYKSLELSQSEPKVNYDDPHNNYLGVWAKMGIIGIVSYLSMFLSALWMAYKYLLRETSEQHRIIMAGLVASLLGYAANLLTIFDTLSTALFFYLFLGIISATYYLEDSQITELNTKQINIKWDKFVAYIITFAFISIGLVGSANYINLWRADSYFRIGISYLNAVQNQQGIDPSSLQKAIDYLSAAHSIYPSEPYYSLNLSKAYGLGAYILKAQNNQESALQLYQLAQQVALSHAHDTWAPENLYLIVGFNAYYMDKLDEAIKYLEKIFEWDKWFYGAHISTSQIYYSKWQQDGNIKDLESAWKHANTARIVLRFFPNFNFQAFQLTYQQGIQLVNKYIETSQLHQAQQTILSSLDAILVYSIYQNPGNIYDEYKKLLTSQKDLQDFSSSATVSLRVAFIDQLINYQKAKSVISNLINGEGGQESISFQSEEQQEEYINAIKTIETIIKSLENMNIPENFLLTDKSTLKERRNQVLTYMKEYIDNLPQS